MLSMAPSSGFALKTETEWEFIPLNATADERRLALALASKRQTSKGDANRPASSGHFPAPQAPLEQAVDALRPTWPQVHLGSLEINARSKLNFGSLDLAPMRASAGKAVNWDMTQTTVERLGFDVRQRQRSSPCEAAKSEAAYGITVFEVYREDVGVISEGRDIDPIVARRIAVAEAVERILAVGTSSIPKVLSDAAELRNGGYIVPNMHVGVRDGFHEGLTTLWTTAWGLDGNPAMLPVDSILCGHKLLGYIQSFYLGHTCGLAAGTTIEEAVFVGFLEIIERDAYWLAMTTRPTVPSFNDSDLRKNNPELGALLDGMKGSGLTPHFTNLQFDWPVPIVHVLLEASGGDMPAFSHGISAHRDAKKAAVKALMEALQLRSGQELSMEGELKAAVLPLPGRPPELAWADPAFRPVVAHLMDDVVRRQELPNATNLLSADEIISAIQEVGGEFFYSVLGKMGDLYAVRVFAPDAIPPNPNPIEIAQPRLQKWLASNGLSHPYSDPILT